MEKLSRPSEMEALDHTTSATAGRRTTVAPLEAWNRCSYRQNRCRRPQPRNPPSTPSTINTLHQLKPPSTKLPATNSSTINVGAVKSSSRSRRPPVQRSCPCRRLLMPRLPRSYPCLCPLLPPSSSQSSAHEMEMKMGLMVMVDREMEMVNEDGDD
ncbi:hypothetical protein Dimus_013120 [Dionaea muscipula]